MAMTSSEKLHMGRKVVRIRELRGMKQEGLAEKLGVSQQTISKIENSEFIEEERLTVIAAALEVTPDIIRHFNEDALFNNIQHNCDTASHNVIVNYQLSPIDKLVELYDKLLESKQEQIRLLEELLKKEKEKK
jgi:transcriptional regulator with XRE-family HTH domain